MALTKEEILKSEINKVYPNDSIKSFITKSDMIIVLSAMEQYASQREREAFEYVCELTRQYPSKEDIVR